MWLIPPQQVEEWRFIIPSLEQLWRNWARCRALVKISTVWAKLGTGRRWVTPTWVFSWTTWQLTSICLVCSWKTVKGWLIVIIDGGGLRRWQGEILEEKMETLDLTSCSCQGSILSFRGGFSHSSLFLALPQDESISKEGAITHYRLPGINTPCLVQVWECW